MSLLTEKPSSHPLWGKIWRARLMAALVALLLIQAVSPWMPHAAAQIPRVKYTSDQGYVMIEFLDDDLVHFEFAAPAPGPGVDQPIPTTPMIAKGDYPGPSALADDGEGTLETPQMRVEVEAESLCLTLTDLAARPPLTLTTLCPRDLDREQKGISFTHESFTHAYGLGQQFITPQSSEGDWVGRVRTPGNEMGNAIVNWGGGAVGNVQFPILYLAGAGRDSYALFADNQYPQTWDMEADPWTVHMQGDWLRFYVMTGPDLPDLRKDYMELVGRPPVPPKKMFGLWVSEYGFDSWQELDDKLRSLRANGFPIDGFVLDLQWFGGVEHGADDSPMGSLTWDRSAFPDPERKIAELEQKHGIGIVVIEHGYVSRARSAYQVLANQGYLARDCAGCSPLYLNNNPYWGKGGMIDWTNPAAGAFWHDWKREPLIEDGVIGHWTDLGEPQMYDPRAWYVGWNDRTALHAHQDVHNLYNLAWSRSIYEGYARNGRQQRPFILSRSGAPGIQRYGASMWSADIGANTASLATHMNAQLHMSMSGIDYYGSDIGGFYRTALDRNLNELYTQWFADSMAFDIPVRTHTENLCNCRETAPDRVGDLASNLANARRRYALTPYLYSLAHRAYRYGEPVVPPLVHYYQDDVNVREMGHEKLIGRDLLVAIVAAHGETRRHVYLPPDEWIDVHTLDRYHSSGRWYGPFAEYEDDLFRLPAFARAGAILPQMYVDEGTMNVSGDRIDGTRQDQLIVRVYADQTPSDFTLYEDDGETIAYQEGAVRTTRLSQVQTGQQVTVTVDGAAGIYAGAPVSRSNRIELDVDGPHLVVSATLNGAPLPYFAGRAEFEAEPVGWHRSAEGLILAKSGVMAVDQPKTFVFHLGHTTYIPVVVKPE